MSDRPRIGRSSRGNDAANPAAMSGAEALLRYAGQVGRRFAIVNAAERRARELEERFLNGIGDRLQTRFRGREGGGGAARAERAFVVPVHEPPQQLFEELLGMAERQSSEQAHEALCTALLRQLTAEEALLFARLADGQPRAVLHLEAPGRLGVGGERVAGPFSLLGEELPLKVPHMLPLCLRRLLGLELLVEEEPSSQTKARHGSLQTDTAVREAIADLQRRRIRPRLRFASLRLSALGQEVWRSCRPEHGVPARAQLGAVDSG